jgi:hypothetical protein
MIDIGGGCHDDGLRLTGIRRGLECGAQGAGAAVGRAGDEEWRRHGWCGGKPPAISAIAAAVERLRVGNGIWVPQKRLFLMAAIPI